MVRETVYWFRNQCIQKSINEILDKYVIPELDRDGMLESWILTFDDALPVC